MADKSTSKPQTDAKLIARVVKLRQQGKTWNEVRETLKMPALRGQHVRAWLKQNGREGEAAAPPKAKPAPNGGSRSGPFGGGPLAEAVPSGFED